MLENVTLSETDTFEEVNKVLNMLIDNLDQVEAKVSVLDKTTARRSWVNKLLKSEEKGGE